MIKFIDGRQQWNNGLCLIESGRQGAVEGVTDSRWLWNILKLYWNLYLLIVRWTPYIVCKAIGRSVGPKINENSRVVASLDAFRVVCECQAVGWATSSRLDDASQSPVGAAASFHKPLIDKNNIRQKWIFASLAPSIHSNHETASDEISVTVN